MAVPQSTRSCQAVCKMNPVVRMSLLHRLNPLPVPNVTLDRCHASSRTLTSAPTGRREARRPPTWPVSPFYHSKQGLSTTSLHNVLASTVHEDALTNRSPIMSEPSPLYRQPRRISHVLSPILLLVHFSSCAWPPARTNRKLFERLEDLPSDCCCRPVVDHIGSPIVDV